MKINDDYGTFGHSLNEIDITMDRYYASVPVEKQLLAKYITILGTLKANKKTLPPAI